MLLYHFTSEYHLPPILEDAALATTESNVSLSEEHAGPDVVWLTSDPAPDRQGHGLSGSVVDKRAIRFAVDVEDARPWRSWAVEQGMTSGDMDALVRAADGGADTWFVVERPIPLEDWAELAHMPTVSMLLGRVHTVDEWQEKSA